MYSILEFFSIIASIIAVVIIVNQRVTLSHVHVLSFASNVWCQAAILHVSHPILFILFSFSFVANATSDVFVTSSGPHCNNAHSIESFWSILGHLIESAQFIENITDNQAQKGAKMALQSVRLKQTLHELAAHSGESSHLKNC